LQPLPGSHGLRFQKSAKVLDRKHGTFVAAPERKAVAMPFAKRVLRVLVVDDNDDAAQSLAWLVNRWGYEARIAADGRSALELAAEFRPDVVLCDVAMPGMSGLETARRLRDECSPNPLLVAVTAYGTEQDRNRTREAGFRAHLVKPVEPEQVRLLLWQYSTGGF
jgi:CheY-like chemotaxis protein